MITSPVVTGLLAQKRSELDRLKFQIKDMGAETEERKDVLERMRRRIHHVEQEVADLEGVLTVLENHHDDL